MNQKHYPAVNYYFSFKKPFYFIFKNILYNFLVKITFGTTNLRLYDNHLMDVMSFLPTFLGFIFESGKRNKIRLFKNKPRPFKSNKQDKVLLTFENVNLVNIIDFNDIISCSFNDMELLADKVIFHLKNILFIINFLNYVFLISFSI